MCLMTGCSSPERGILDTQQVVEPTPLVIELPEEDPTTGMLTIYTAEGEVYFQYYGNLEVLNNEGELEINVTVSDLVCSCFSGEGVYE